MSDLTLPQGITAVVEHGLDAYRIDTPLASGLVFRLGAHVAEWTPTGAQPVLWTSAAAVYQPGRAIRGGVPICFPWFGPGREGDRSPAHGFARTSTWTLVEASVDEAGEARLALELTAAAVDDLGGFPDDFTLRLQVTMGTSLQLELVTTAGEQGLDIEEALHSYFHVGEVGRVTVEGLDGARYLDKVTGDEQVQQGAVEFIAETDRVYLSTATTTIVDPTQDRRIVVDKQHSADTVVWNPWVAKSAAMSDFGDDEWHDMCCVETVNCLADAVRVAPGESHVMTARISLG